MSQGIATIDTKLEYAVYTGSALGDYTRVEGLQSVPALMPTVSKIDTTVLKDTIRKSIPGLKDFGDLSFGCLYDKTEFKAIKALEGELCSLKVTLPDGESFTFDCYITAGIDAQDLDNAIKYTITAFLQSEIVEA